VAGRVLDAKPGKLGSRLVYVLTVLMPNGVLKRIRVDAQTGKRL